MKEWLFKNLHLRIRLLIVEREEGTGWGWGNHIYIYIHTHTYTHTWRERETLIHWCEKHRSRMRPDRRSNLQRRHVPWLGIKPATLWCMGCCSNQLEPPGQGRNEFFKSGIIQIIKYYSAKREEILMHATTSTNLENIKWKKQDTKSYIL